MNSPDELRELAAELEASDVHLVSGGTATAAVEALRSTAALLDAVVVRVDSNDGYKVWRLPQLLDGATRHGEGWTVQLGLGPHRLKCYLP